MRPSLGVRRKGRGERVWLFVALVCFAFRLALAATAEPPLLDEFRASVRQWTAGAGSVVFSTEQPEDSEGAGRTTFGFDPATGAWFSASQAGASGRTPDGVYYSGSPDNVAPMPDQKLSLPAPMGGRIPMALPLLLLQTTDGLVDITKDNNSNWVIDYLGFAPEGVKRPLARVVFSPQGRPLRFESEARPASRREAPAYDYEFVPESREPLLITLPDGPSNARLSPRKVIEIEYHSTSRPELFTTEAVLALAVDNRMRTQMRLNALAARSAKSDPAEDGAGRAPYVEHRLSRAGWPLIVSGIIVVAIGLIALFRARAAR